MLRKIGLFSARAFANASSLHAIPVHGIMLVLQQIGRFFCGKTVRMFDGHKTGLTEFYTQLKMAKRNLLTR